MSEISGRERAIKAMNFEMTDRLPIMANGFGSPKFVMNLTGLTEEEYWADQPGAHYKASVMMGMDFFIQKWFPPKVQTTHWTAQYDEQWKDPDAVAEHMERFISENDAGLAGLEQNREYIIDDICRYQTETQEEMGEDLLWVFGMDSFGPAIIHFPYGEYGYEGFFITLALYPDLFEKYWQSRAKSARIHNECVAEAAKRLNYPKIGYLGTDVTDQRGNMVSPAVMDKLYFPQLDYAIKPLVDAGFKLIWHSDGNMNDMLSPLIDIGIAGFQGFQEECGTKIKDAAKLRARNGDPLILWGSCSVIDVLLKPNNNAAIKKEVQRVLDEWPHPGLCLATASYLSPDIPDGNLELFYKYCRELGKGRQK
jgi:hypothetical protein